MSDWLENVNFGGANNKTRIMAEEKKEIIKPKIFISWCNDANNVGKQIGGLFNTFVSNVFGGRVDVYYSPDSNGVWQVELLSALQSSTFGIFIMTPESMDSPWMSFEFGSIFLRRANDKFDNVKRFILPVCFSEHIDKSNAVFQLNQIKQFERKNIVAFLEKIKETQGFPKDDDFSLLNSIDTHWSALQNGVDAVLKEIKGKPAYVRNYKLREELVKKEDEITRLSVQRKETENADIEKLRQQIEALTAQNKSLVSLNNELTSKLNRGEHNSRQSSPISTDDLSRFLTDNMVLVDGGSFWMDKRTGYRVNLRSFYIGKFQVTQNLWKKIMGINPSRFDGNGEKPVERVTWYDAACFCNRLSMEMELECVYELTQREYDTDDKGYQHIVKADVKIDIAKFGFRLPTEAEWEYAARGGNQNSNNDYEFSGSNNIDDVAVYRKNSRDLGTDNPNYGTHTVGSKNKNALGIYDMSGNVWEWCQDWSGDYPTEQIVSDPQGPASGAYRVSRGGSWDSYADYCRVSFRLDYAPDDRRSIHGFRLLLSSPKK